MTIPFFCIFIAFLLNMISKAPVALAMARRPGGYDNKHPRDQEAALEGWGRRAFAAHLNGFEAFPAFAAAVVIAQISGADPVWSTRLAVAFVIARVFYTPLYIFDLDLLRSAVWTFGFMATCGLFLLPFVR
jgi:uncharacterized MAPEG superfamily protein